MATGQQDMFGAKLARDDALKRVEGNAGDWMEKALAAVTLLDSGRLMTGEDIRVAIVKDVGEPHHHNAWGAMIKNAIKQRLIVPTGKWRHMKLPQSHARNSPIYRIC